MIEAKQLLPENSGVDDSLRAFLGSMSVAISLSRGEQLLYVNHAYLRLIDDDGGEQNDVSVLARLTPVWRGIVTDARLGEVSSESSRQASTGSRTDGSKFQCHIEVAQLDLQSGATTITFITDITDITDY